MRPDVFDLPEPVERAIYGMWADTLRSVRELLWMRRMSEECGLDETWQVLRAKRGSRR